MNGSSVRGAISLAALLFLVACQGTPESGGSPPPVPADELEAVPLPEDLPELADMVVERMNTARTVRVDISVEPEGEITDPVEETTVDLQLGDSPAAVMEVVESDKETPTTTNIVVIDGVVYTELAGQELVEGKPWIRLSREDIAAVEGELGPFTQIFTTVLDEVDVALEQASGSQAMDMVRHGELASGPEPAGQDTSLTRYAGQTSTGDLAEAGHTDMRALSDAGLDTIDWTLTVTDRGLPHDQTVHLLTPGGEQAVSTVSYRDWGQRLDIQAPPEDITATLREAL